MATIRLASVTGSTYCGCADGDSRVASTASTPATGQARPPAWSCGARPFSGR